MKEVEFTEPDRHHIRQGAPIPPPRVKIRNAFTVPPSLEGLVPERFVREPYRK